MTKPKKMALTSMDITQEKRNELKRCLGSAFSEVVVGGVVDFDKLRPVLGNRVKAGETI